MKHLLDAFWRAAVYCLHPRVVLLSILPLLLSAGLSFALGYFLWHPTVDALQTQLMAWPWATTAFDWLEATFALNVRTMVAPAVVVALAVPVIVIVSLLLVAVLMTPAIVNLVAARRFSALERRHGAPLWQSVLWSLACTVAALLALALSVPLWLIPPLVLVLPPLIWGWLTYRVMTFDVLAEHADAAERRRILAEHRLPLLGIGVITGYLGAAPSLVWAIGAAALVFAPILLILSIWLYTLVFAFASLWFAHYALAALARLRGQPLDLDAPAQPQPPGAPSAGDAARSPTLPPPLPREPFA